jgi:hypothetical protein
MSNETIKPAFDRLTHKSKNGKVLNMEPKINEQTRKPTYRIKRNSSVDEKIGQSRPEIG